MSRRRHRWHKVLLVTAGVVRVGYDDAEVTVGAGQVTIIAAGTAHSLADVAANVIGIGFTAAAIRVNSPAAIGLVCVRTAAWAPSVHG